MMENEKQTTTTTATSSSQPQQAHYIPPNTGAQTTESTTYRETTTYQAQPATTAYNAQPGAATATYQSGPKTMQTDATHPLFGPTICDNLYIAATIFCAFSSALAFPGMWNVALHYNHISNTYVAFAFLFLFFSWPETIFLIGGLTGTPSERTNMLGMTILFTLWNLICLIIPIATEFVGFPRENFNYDGMGVAPACLIAALGAQTFCFIAQLVSLMITAKKDPKTLPAYQPVVFLKPVARDLFVANAVLFNIVLALATGSLIFLAPIQGADFTMTYYAGAAFTVVFFFTALIGVIVSIVALFPSAIPNRTCLGISWVLAIFCFAFALTAWFCQLFSLVGTLPYTHLMALLGWIVALATICVGLATFFVIDERVGSCCGVPNQELYQARELADIEKARYDAVQYRKQREALERSTQVV